MDVSEFRDRRVNVRNSGMKGLCYVLAWVCISAALLKSLVLSHPESNDLAFLYGIILTDGNDENDEIANFVVFADKEVRTILVYS